MGSGTSRIKQVAVVGAGQMGAGIAQAFAASRFSVLLADVAPDAVKRGTQTIEKSLSKFVEKQKITEADKEETLRRIVPANSLGELKSVGLVIEAIVEKSETKIALFQELDRICPAETIFATNTSSISITRLAAGTKRPDRMVGMHFMNPVPLMKLVELIRGLQTSDETFQVALDLVQALGKTAVKSNFDYPGFIVNRILMPMLNEACFVLMEGLASAEDIDTAMKLGTNQPMGPLELADLVGLDTVLAISRIFHEELGDDKYRPCPLLIKYVEAGWLGRKTGRGFYKYS